MRLNLKIPKLVFQLAFLIAQESNSVGKDEPEKLLAGYTAEALR